MLIKSIRRLYVHCMTLIVTKVDYIMAKNMYKRAKGREEAYAKLNGHDSILPEMPMNKKAKWFREVHDVAEMEHHAKGLDRPRLSYARMVARARKDNFYDNIRVAQGV